MAPQCYYCKTKHRELTRDHKFPLGRGGADTQDNVVLACGRCNRVKADMTEAEFRRYIELYGFATPAELKRRGMNYSEIKASLRPLRRHIAGR